MRAIVLLAVAWPGWGGEVYRLNLKGALERALEQAPEVLLGRLDEANARQGVEVARDPFAPKLVMGSGLAYTYGFPMSIEGSAPSVFQVKASQSLFNRPQSYLLAKAKVEARSAQEAVGMKRDEVIERTARLFLDAERAGRGLELTAGQIGNLEAVLEGVKARVEEGRGIAIDLRRAEVNLKKARQRRRLLEAEKGQIERQLAFVLGYGGEDRVEVIRAEGYEFQLAAGLEAGVKEALERSRELKKLQTDLEAKTLEVSANQSARTPQVDLVAQYALFARFNNFDQYFSRFQTSNAQLGVSFKFPIVAGPASAALAAQARNEVSRLRVRVVQTRNRIEVETRKLYEDLELHRENRELAKLDLELAREQITVTLAQMEEGRATRRQLEEARFLEAEKWIGYWDAQYLYDRARLAVVSATGGLANLASK
jgi:outer membrane protein